MWFCTGRTVLPSVLQNDKRPAAVIKMMKRTVAEQAVEIILPVFTYFMAGKILTLAILEKLIRHC